MAPMVAGVRQNDLKWRLAIDKAIMECWHDGTFAKLYQKYIGGSVPFALYVWPDYLTKK